MSPSTLMYVAAQMARINHLAAVKIPPKLAEGLQFVQYIVIGFAAVLCVINVIKAANNASSDPAEAKKAVLNVVWTAGAAAIVYGLFTVLGLNDATDDVDAFDSQN